MSSERTRLGSGETVDQGLIPGVAPVDQRVKAIADEIRRRAAKRGNAAPPSGGLFDEQARAQGDLVDLMKGESTSSSSPPKPQTDLFGGAPAAKGDQGSLFNKPAKVSPDEEWSHYAKVYDEQIADLEGRLKEAQRDLIPDTRGQGVQYHGARAPIAKLEEGYYGPANIYGGIETFYTTDAVDIAKGYGRKQPNAAIHTVTERAPVKTYDMEKPLAREEVNRLFGVGGDEDLSSTASLVEIAFDEAERGGKASLREVMDEARALSAGEGLSRDDVQEIFDNVAYNLQQDGYGAMRHVGGQKTGRKAHEVKIYFRPHEQLDLGNIEPSKLEPSPEARAKVETLERQLASVRKVRSEHEASIRGGKGDEPTPAEKPIVKNEPAKVDNPPPEPAKADAPDEQLERTATAPSDARKPTGGPPATPEQTRALKPPTETITTLSRQLKRALNITHRQGKITRRALGTYNLGSGVVRTQQMHEMEVFAHESFHALEYKKTPALMAALQAHRAELEANAYVGAAQKFLRQEGFAEFGRWYVTDAVKARTRLPNFYGAFEVAMAKDMPREFAILKEIQARYEEVMTSDALQFAMGNMVTDQGGGGGIGGGIGKLIDDLREFGGDAPSKWMNDLYTRMIDDLHPMQMAVKTIEELHYKQHGKKLILKATENPYIMMRTARGAQNQGFLAVMDGVRGYHSLDKISPGLAEALDIALGKNWTPVEYKKFNAYLAARRLVFEWGRYARGEIPKAPAKGTAELWRKAVSTFEDAYPKAREAAAKVHEFAAGLWQLRMDAGLITVDQYTHGLTIEDYVPLIRDMSDGGEVTGEPGDETQLTKTGSISAGDRKYVGGVDRFQGSLRDIMDPIQSLMQEAFDLHLIVARNDALGALLKISQTVVGGGAIAEKVPLHQTTVQKVDALDLLAERMKLQMMPQRDIDAEIQRLESLMGAKRGKTEVNVYGQKEVPRDGEPVVYYWENGEKIPVRLSDGEFGKEMFDALAALNPYQSNLVVGSMAVVSQALRAGITSHPEFLFSNFIRDQLATWVNTDVGFFPFVSGAVGAYNEIARTQLSRDYSAAGGIKGGSNMASLDKARMAKDFRSLRNRGFSITRVPNLGEVGRSILRFPELGETATRFAVFDLARKQAIKRGLTPWEAAMEASFTARDALDFDRHGSKMMSAVRIVTFLNAQLQGLDKALRVASASGGGGGGGHIGLLRDLFASGKDPSRKLTASEAQRLKHAWKMYARLLMIGMVGLLLSTLYQNDPELEEISPYLRQTHWMIKQAPGVWIAVPKPFELAVVSSVFERAFELLVKHDPNAIKNFGGDLKQMFGPPVVPTALKLPFELAANRDSNGNPIVPEHLRQGDSAVIAELQYNAYNTEFSKRMGRALNMSPAQIDYAVAGAFGSWGRSALGLSEVALKDKFDIDSMKAAGPTDAFVLRRFVRDVTRGSASATEFWDQVSATDGKMISANGTFRKFVDQGDAGREKAKAFLMEEDPAARSFALAKALFKGKEEQLHPMIRAQAVVKELGELRRDLSDGPVRAPGDRVVALSPGQAKEAGQMLAYMSMAEMRNALLESGVKGWAQKAPISTEDLRARLQTAFPEVAEVLEWRSNKILDEETARRRWQDRREYLESEAAIDRAANIIDRDKNAGVRGMERRKRAAPEVE